MRFDGSGGADMGAIMGASLLAYRRRISAIRQPADAIEVSAATAPAQESRARYNQLAHEALNGDEAARTRIGADPATPAELLYFLAVDRCLAVRVAVAMNRATPKQADHHLVHDPDERVRAVLARKLATLVPELGIDDVRRLRDHAWTNLAVLVEDHAARVRTIVAEMVADMPDAPRALILRLASDAEFSVSDKVLRLSPALLPDDLLSLLAVPPAAHTAASIAGRTDITADIADAIAASANTEAISRLLRNRSAGHGGCRAAAAHRAARRPALQGAGPGLSRPVPLPRPGGGRGRVAPGGAGCRILGDGAGRRHRLGQDRGVFGGCGRMHRRRAPGAGAAAGDRAVLAMARPVRHAASAWPRRSGTRI